jgi:predicted porin
MGTDVPSVEQGEKMKGLGASAASAAVIMLSGVGGAFAADLGPYPVKALPPPGPAVCTSILDFFTTACQLSAYGVRFYGTLDVGYGYQTHGTPMDPTIGTDYLLGKPSRGPMWVQAPNAMSVSNIGFQVKEPLWQGWSFVGQVEAGFNPYTMQLLDAPASLRTGIGVPIAQQNAITDANFNGQFYNDLGFAGFSHPVWGTLTFGRQNSLGADQVLSYDPQQSAAGFSTLGLIGTWAGGGDTENRKDTLSVKYRNNIANYHFGLYATLGGYDVGNASTQAYYGNFGGDWNVGPGKLSADVTAGWRQNAIGEGPGGLVGAVGLNGFPVSPTTSTVEFLSASLSDNTQIMVSGKYQLDRLKLYAGWDFISFSSPDGATPNCVTDISGYALGACTGTQASGIPVTEFNTAIYNGRILQMVWFGGRYELTNSLDLSAGYYHAWQNDWSHGQLVTPAGGLAAGAAPPPGGWCANHPSIQLPCAGTQDVVSLVLDWKFAPKWDTYIGTTYTHQDGGLISGYLNSNDWSTTAGLRFRW